MRRETPPTNVRRTGVAAPATLPFLNSLTLSARRAARAPPVSASTSAAAPESPSAPSAPSAGPYSPTTSRDADAASSAPSLGTTLVLKSAPGDHSMLRHGPSNVHVGKDDATASPSPPPPRVETARTAVVGVRRPTKAGGAALPGRNTAGRREVTAAKARTAVREESIADRARTGKWGRDVVLLTVRTILYFFVDSRVDRS
mmetsp:Transcript_24737/g.49214  ORF Transcript_24737/g.49214 Transcript_24737/m.49214 type:complete len:201 (-) Transcript_24737:26-628(-)